LPQLVCKETKTEGSGANLDRQEVRNDAKRPLPEAGNCHFFVQRKKRFCKMTVKSGADYCGEHTPVTDQMADSELRVPCPYDPKHTCAASRIEKHLKICNFKPPDKLPEYLVPGINRGSSSLKDKEKMALSQVPDEKLINIIGMLMTTYKATIEGNIELEYLEHSVLQEELNNPEYGPGVLKHLIQNASLLGHLKASGLLDLGNMFIEFGSGRGQLTYWLTKAVPDPSTCEFVLVDRASQRHKFDNRLKDTEQIKLLRLRADISDLSLSHVQSQLPEKKVVGISKHLCGAATDLSIRCLTKTLDETELGGLIIALCCHHRCDWTSYVGKKFLIEQGYTEEYFPLLCSLSSWATCGSGKPRSKMKDQEDNNPNKESTKVQSSEISHNTEKESQLNIDRYTRLQLDQSTREEIGRQAKRILDYGRLKYLEENTKLDLKLKYYTDTSISLENVLIVSTPREDLTG